MSDKEKPKTNSAPKCNLVLLLLFVGFIFGFTAGYASKDTIVKALSKVANTDIEVTSKDSPKTVGPSTTASEPVSPETEPKDDDESKEEPKVPEAEKPAGQP